jgi:beta-lactamase regulating signal transducer with metallopeptidase domain
MEANLLQQLISTGPAEVLISSLWQGLLLTACAWACLKLIPGLRASTRFTVWLIVFLLVALLPCFALVAGTGNAHSAYAVPQPGLHLNAVWAYVIEGIWIVASLLSLARLIGGARQMRITYRNSTPVPFSDLVPQVQAIVSRLDARPVDVRLSDAVDAPGVIGFFRPAVVVPRTLWHELSSVEQKHIIQHEVAHLERGDDWMNLLQKLFRSLSPLNPALFWAERHLCIEREQACDDAVLDAAGDPRAYATCLTRLAESRIVRRAAALAPGLWKRHSELTARVENILHRRPTLSPLFSRGLVAASLLLALSGALVLQRCPGLISFANQLPHHDAIVAETVVPRAGSLVQARYENQNQANYQDAVFHPAVTNQRVVPVKHPAAKPRSKARRTPSGNMQLIEMQNGEGVTLIFFSVDAQSTTNWIAFQI